MLDHDEQRRLIEIEAQLRLEAPELHRLFETEGPSGSGPAAHHTAHRPRPMRGLPASSPARPHVSSPDSTGLGAHPEPAPRPVEPEVFDAWPAISPVRAIVRSCVALVLAIGLTALTTVLLGPDIGGLVAVVALAVATMYAYQVLRGCPGLRARRRDRH